MSAFSFSKPPSFDDYNFAAILKTTGEIVVVSISPVAALTDAAEKTGLPKDCFELRQISKQEYERLKTLSGRFGPGKVSI